MLLSKHLEEYVKKFCEIKKIPVFCGSIPSKYEDEIKDFIQNTLKQERSVTRRIEAENKVKIDATIQNMIKVFVESPIEEYLYQALVRNGLDKHCRSQFEIGNKRVDFAFPIAKLAVECDGKKYHFTEAEQIERDQERDKYLARKGWRVLHIEGLAIRRNINLCIEEIRNQLKPYVI